MRACYVLLLASAVLGAGPARSGDIAAALDLLEARPGSMQFFTGPYVIPAGFFGPGSDPFTGAVQLTGLPVHTFSGCPDPLGTTSVVVRRNQDAHLACCPDGATIETELVALSLVSVNPITVTYNGGGSPEQWNVRVGLSATPPPQAGQMQIQQGTPQGGTFSAQLPFIPLFEFVKVQPQPEPPRALDFGPSGFFDLFVVLDAPWSHAGPPSLLDTSCDSEFRPGVVNATQEPGFAAERGNRYNYNLQWSTVGGPTPARRTSWGRVKSSYR